MAGVWADDFEVRTVSLGIWTSTMRVLAVTRQSLPWNRYVIVKFPFIAVRWIFALQSEVFSPPFS